MKHALAIVCITLILAGFGGFAGAGGDKGTKDIIDKAIKALGGEEKLGKVQAMSWKTKGTISFGDNESQFTSQTIVQDLDHLRREFEGEFGGNKFKAVTVINGDQGWRVFGDNNMELEKDAIANEKRNAYLQIMVLSIMPLKGKGFKTEAAPEAKVGDKTALVLKATGPDGKDCTLYFDKASSLALKQVAKVIGFQGDEYTQETTFGNFKDFDGIKRPTKIVNLRDGQKFIDQEVTEFRLLSKVDPKTFAKPE